jgi:hypothetical protein
MFATCKKVTEGEGQGGVQSRVIKRRDGFPQRFTKKKAREGVCERRYVQSKASPLP